MPDRKFRVLITGSRSWTDEQTIRDALAPISFMYGPENVVVVHGHCPDGADALADRIASAWGITVERHPADWGTCAPTCRPDHRKRRGDSTYCPSAGHRRNAEMVALGADVCLSFVDPCAMWHCPNLDPHGSHGASHTTYLAKAAGIPTRRFPEDFHG
ncbi:DUF2493 domain-containing protein [Nonomuraea sp. NPDC059194]|uniref:DUF2493 domain-containing protein n=1 Tax=Nonomuraea sp. NPDC059194 TaxID=3346764 RepID=UPI0036930B37